MDAGHGVHNLLIARQLRLGGPDPRGGDRHHRHLHSGVVSPAEEEASAEEESEEKDSSDDESK